HVPRRLLRLRDRARGGGGGAAAGAEPRPRGPGRAAHPPPAEDGVKRRTLLSLGLAVVAAAFLLPQLWLFSVSLKTKAGVYEYPPRWLPADPQAGNYAFVLGRTQVPTYLANSARVA